MKTIFSTILIVLSAQFTFAQTNVYQPYPADNSSWTIHTQYFNGTSLIQDWVTEDWGGQITINGQTYTEVTGDNLIVGVRQDIPNEKIFYVDTLGGEHDASFDQSIQQGDTVLLTEAFRSLNMSPEGGTWAGVDTVVVQAVDSILVGPSYRKRFSLDGVPFDNQYIYDCSYICGVGCSGYVTFEAGFTLDCFYVNGDLYFGDPFNPYCTASTEELPAHNISIYPNPSEDRFFINYDSSFDLKEVHLLDVTGKRQVQFDSKNAQNGYDISNLPCGMYLVELVFDQGSFRTSLIK